MRCLSPHSNYSIQAFEAQEQIVVDARGYAQTITLTKPQICNFHQGGLLDHEIDAALEHFDFSGLPEGVNPLTRVASFDTEMYAETFPKNQRDEMIVQLDERLRELQAKFPNEFIICEAPRKSAPWPTYDEDNVADILKFSERLQVNPEHIRLYELENKNRTKIVEEMEARERAVAGLPPLEKNEEEVIVSA